MHDLEYGHDFISTYSDNSSSDPTVAGTELLKWTGSTGNYLDQTEIPQSHLTSICTIGFNLTSDTDNNDFGVAITDFSISALKLDTTSYKTISGTSMAAPHAAGLASLIWSLNSGYSYLEFIESIKNGGENILSLAEKTSTGKAANALWSLRYAVAPIGVTATVEQWRKIKTKWSFLLSFCYLILFL